MDALRGNIKAVFCNVAINYRLLRSGFYTIFIILCFRSYVMIHSNKHNNAQTIYQATIVVDSFVR